MVAKLCKYCNVQMLEGFDEEARKFYEKGTRTLHTRERCEAIRNNAGTGPKQGHLTAAGAGIEQWAAIGAALDSVKTQLNNMESKIDQALAKLRGQDTLEGNE